MSKLILVVSMGILGGYGGYLYNKRHFTHKGKRIDKPLPAQTKRMRDTGNHDE